MAQTPEGAAKIAAKKAGLPVADYLEKRAAGMKRCVRCKEWKAAAHFGIDRTRWDGLQAGCRVCTARKPVESPKPRVNPKTGRSGPERAAARDGDQRQARRSVNREVEQNRLPHPSTLACVDCGHTGTDRRHEYDHHNGYGPEHHLDVVPVCTTCHARRTFRK